MNESSRRLIVLALSAAIGCGDDTVSAPVGTIALSASPPTVTVPQGGRAIVGLTLVRGGGFSGAVSIAATALPTGISTTLTPMLIPGSTVADLQLDVAVTVAPGTYAGTIYAAAPGLASTSVAFTLVVTQRPAYSLSSNSEAVSIYQGASGSADIQVNRTNFTSSVSLSVANAPNGISCDFAPVSVTGDSATLTISVASTVAPGPYALTVTGSATGMEDRNTTVAINVAQRPDFALSVPATPIAIVAGSTGQVIVDISRTNFSGAVSLSLVAPPAGVTGTFNPASTTDIRSALDISVAGSISSGTFTLTIKGTAPGVSGDRTTVLQLTVTVPELPPPPPTPPSQPPTSPPSPPISPPASGDFILFASTGAVFVMPDGNANPIISVSRTNLTADIALSVGSPTPGITAVLNPSTLSGAIVDATLTISVGASVAPGNYSITIQGTAAGLTRTTTLAVSVLAPGSGFSLSTNGFFIPQGAACPAWITITRTNFSGPVSFQLQSPPAGITGMFYPSPTTGGFSSMDVTVQPSVPPGLYNLAVVGSAPGLPDRTATFPLTVIPRGDFGIDIAPNAFDTNRGATLTAMVTVGRFNWPADIGLSIYWNTAGISSALSTSVLKGGALTSTLTINVGPDAPLGRGAVGVRATSGCFEYDFVVDVIVLSEG